MADIGATTTRCALLDDKGQELAPEVFENANFTGVAGVLSVYLDHRRASDRPTRAALAVAAPITGDEVQMINIDWRFSQAELKETLRLKRLEIVNDFAAIAWAMPLLTPADVYPRLGPTSEWDTAAAQAILESAGGRMIDLAGRPLRYNTKDHLLNPHFLAFGDQRRNWLAPIHSTSDRQNRN